MRKNLIFSTVFLTCAVAFTVITGHILKIAPLIQAIPSSVPMAFNAATSFILSALSLAFLTLSRKRLAFTLACFALLLPALSLLEYAAEIDLGIDTFFASNFVIIETAHPGRMAPLTCVSFIIFGLCLLALSDGKLAFSRQLTGIVGGMLILLLGSLAFLGYVFHVQSLYGWGYFPRMAVHTALCFVFLGTGLITYACQLTASKETNLEVLRLQLLCYSIAGTLFIGIFSSNAGLLPSFSYLEESARESIMINAVNKGAITAEWVKGLDETVKQLSSRTVIRQKFAAYQAGQMTAEELQTSVATDLVDALSASDQITGICRTSGVGCVLSSGEKISEENITSAEESDAFVTGPYEANDRIFFIAKGVVAQNGPGVFTDLYVVNSKSLVDALLLGKERTTSDVLLLGIPNTKNTVLLKLDAGSSNFSVVVDDSVAVRKVLHDSLTSSRGSYQSDVSVSNAMLIGYAMVPTLPWLVIDKVDPGLIFAGTFSWIGTAFTLVAIITFLGALGMFFMLRPLQRQMFIHSNALEEKVREKTKEVLRTSEFKSQFLANMSHEIRTPLTAILGFAEQLRESNVNPSVANDFLAAIGRNGGHLLSLINDILDISKIEAGKMEIEQIPCSPLEILREVIDLMEPKASEKGLVFQLNLVFPLPDKIVSDPTRFKQILLNLVSNAIKFTENGFVRVKFEFNADRKTVNIGIEDSGIGITDEQRVRVFTAFNQADASTTRKFGGSGLGLTITNELIRLLGGKLEIESKVKVGSKFLVELPVGDREFTLLFGEPVRPASMGTVKTPKIPKLSGSILLVEDSEDIRTMVSHIIKRTGAQLTLAENGQIGVDFASKEQFDLILMDMQMPVMDGYTATSVLRKKEYRAPIVGLTANTINNGLQKCLDAGCNEAMAKPFERDQFYAMLAKYLTLQAAPEVPKNQPVLDPEEAKIRTNFLLSLVSARDRLQKSIIAEEWITTAREAHRLAGAALFGLKDISKEAKALEELITKTPDKAPVPENIRNQAKVLFATIAKYVSENGVLTGA